MKKTNGLLIRNYIVDDTIYDFSLGKLFLKK